MGYYILYVVDNIYKGAVKVEDNYLEDELWERREYRRKRRIRNQIIVYISMAVFVIGIVGAAVFGVKHLVGTISDKKQAAELERQLEEMAEAEEPVTVEAPEEYAEASPPEEEVDPLDSVVDTCIAELPIEDKVAGLFFVTPEELTGTTKVIKAGDTTKEKLREYAVGGLIYFKDNIKSKEQLSEMLNNTRTMSKYPIFLGVDEEGGTVARVAESKIGEKVDSMGKIGKEGDPAKAYQAGSTIGSYLSELGFNVDFAPVADVLSSEDNTVLGERSFGTDPELVAGMVSSAVGGLKDTGVNACLKHFPGLGNTSEDSHDGMAATESSLDEMRATDFGPFKAGIDAGAAFVMVSHLSAPNVTGDNTPASLSSQMISEVLRGELGFNGIVITDALNMAAITDYYTSDEACIKALQAGADMLLMPENFEEAYQGVLQAVQNGTISEERIDESLRRIYRVKYAGQVIE